MPGRPAGRSGEESLFLVIVSFKCIVHDHAIVETMCMFIRKALRRLRGPNENIDEELSSIQQSLQPESKPYGISDDHDSLEVMARSRPSTTWISKRPPTKNTLQILGLMVLQQ